jgi:hypothetical protein
MKSVIVSKNLLHKMVKAISKITLDFIIETNDILTYKITWRV